MSGCWETVPAFGEWLWRPGCVCKLLPAAPPPPAPLPLHPAPLHPQVGCVAGGTRLLRSGRLAGSVGGGLEQQPCELRRQRSVHDSTDVAATGGSRPPVAPLSPALLALPACKTHHSSAEVRLNHALPHKLCERQAAGRCNWQWDRWLSTDAARRAARRRAARLLASTLPGCSPRSLALSARLLPPASPVLRPLPALS